MANAYGYQNTFNDPLAEEFREILKKPFPLHYPNLVAWFDFSDDRYLITANGTVIQAKDKSENTNHSTQLAFGNRPLFINDAIAGKSVARFDGANDVMTFPNLGMANGGSVFLVYASDHDSGSGNVWGNILGVDGSSYLQTYARHPLFYVHRGDDYISVDFTSSVTNRHYGLQQNIPYIATSISDGQKSTSYINGGDMLEKTGVNMTSGSDLSYMGAFRGDIAEILIYQSVLDNSQRINVEKWLSAKWGIQLQS